MNKTSATFTLIMCACGLLLGYSAGRKGAVLAEGKDTVPEPVRSSTRKTGAISDPRAAQLPEARSNESLATLIAQGENATYAGITAWLLDADAHEIAAYWDSCKDGKLDGDKQRLIFLNWTRLDPQAAIAAVAGTDKAGMPWWAWAASDPQAALSAAGADRLTDVARGIGEFQPKWLMEHFDRIPGEAKPPSLNGLLTWKENEDPLATMDFLQKQGIHFNAALFRTLARKDPWAAFDWLQENNGIDRGSGAIDILLDTMKSGHPDDLERLAAMTPSGALKRKMEDAIFSNLLATDPEAALVRAKAMESPVMAAARLAQIGTSLLATDPEKAFSIGADILAASPDRLAPLKRIDIGDNNTSWGTGESPAETFMDSLMIKDPVRTMEMTTAGMKDGSTTFRTLCGKWADRDLPAFAEWVNRQTEPKVRDAAAGQVISRLTSQGQFQEAAEWAMRGSASNPANLHSIAAEWGQSNPAAASEWLESADIPENVRGNLRNYIRKEP